jgi:hypothetical protein
MLREGERERVRDTEGERERVRDTERGRERERERHRERERERDERHRERDARSTLLLRDSSLPSRHSDLGVFYYYICT